MILFFLITYEVFTPFSDFSGMIYNPISPVIFLHVLIFIFLAEGAFI